MSQQQKIVQNNFTAGELSPLMASRADIGKYHNGCRTLENFITYPQGGAFKRPGTYYVAPADDHERLVRLLPFVYSNSDAYVLEFSHQLIRFYRTVSGVSGLILDDDGTTITELVSPYSDSDLAELQTEGIGDVLYIFHPDYAPRRLVRTDHNSWAISAPTITGGPFLLENDTTTTLQIRIYTIDAVTIGAGGKFRISGDGDLTAFFAANSIFRVNGSTDNNGWWTVSTTAYAGGNFDITVPDTETVGATADGSVRPDLSKDMNLQLQLSAATGAESFAGFEAGHVGALFQLIHDKPTNKYKTSTSGTLDAVETSMTVDAPGYINVAKGQEILFTTHKNWTGTVELEKSYDSGTTWQNVLTIAYVDDGNIETRISEDLDTARYRVNMTAYTSGSCSFNLIALPQEIKGIVKITAVVSTTIATGTVQVEIGHYAPTKKWMEGAWSDKRGWPRALTFFEQRLFAGGTTWNPVGIWSSKSLPGGDYHNFTVGAEEDDALSLTLVESKQDPIQWLSHDRRLLVGTSGGIYAIGASNLTDPLTPINITKSEQHTIDASAPIQPVRTSLGHLYIGRNRRKVHELAYRWDADRFFTPDMARLAEHITGTTGIKEIALQKQPEVVFWCVRNDGALIGLTYLREEEIIGWHRHTTRGAFESVAVIPTTSGEDEVWVVVRRRIGGAAKRYIEKFMPWSWGADLKDAFFMDCGLTRDDQAPINQISGLNHLEGETVAILADGSLHPNRTVSGGVINLDRSARVVHVGLLTVSNLSPMKITGGRLGEGSIKRISHLAINFYQTGQCRYGSDDSTMDVINFGEADDFMDTGSPLYSGTKTLPFPGGYEKDADMIIRSDRPLPCTILSATQLVEVS